MIASLGEEFIRNIIMCINYTVVIIGINYNNTVITNYGRLQDRILLFKFPRTRERICSIFVENLGTSVLFTTAWVTRLNKENEMD